MVRQHARRAGQRAGAIASSPSSRSVWCARRSSLRAIVSAARLAPRRSFELHVLSEPHREPLLGSRRFVVENADYPDWDTVAKAMADYITLRNRTRRTARSPSSKFGVASRDRSPSAGNENVRRTRRAPQSAFPWLMRPFARSRVTAETPLDGPIETNVTRSTREFSPDRLRASIDRALRIHAARATAPDRDVHELQAVVQVCPGGEHYARWCKDRDRIMQRSSKRWGTGAWPDRLPADQVAIVLLPYRRDALGPRSPRRDSLPGRRSSMGMPSRDRPSSCSPCSSCACGCIWRRMTWRTCWPRRSSRSFSAREFNEGRCLTGVASWRLPRAGRVVAPTDRMASGARWLLPAIRAPLWLYSGRLRPVVGCGAVRIAGRMPAMAGGPAGLPLRI